MTTRHGQRVRLILAPTPLLARGCLLAWAAMLAGCLGGRPSVLALPVNAVECRFTEEPPAIDGALDDAAWNQAVTIENFIMPWLGERGAGEACLGGRVGTGRGYWSQLFSWPFLWLYFLHPSRFP